MKTMKEIALFLLVGLFGYYVMGWSWELSGRSFQEGSRWGLIYTSGGFMIYLIDVINQWRERRAR